MEEGDNNAIREGRTHKGKHVDSKRRTKVAVTNSLAGRNLGMLLLGLWLILTGIIPLLNVKLSPPMVTGLAVLAIVAGILILLRR